MNTNTLLGASAITTGVYVYTSTANDIEILTKRIKELEDRVRSMQEEMRSIKHHQNIHYMKIHDLDKAVEDITYSIPCKKMDVDI